MLKPHFNKKKSIEIHGDFVDPFFFFFFLELQSLLLKFLNFLFRIDL